MSGGPCLEGTPIFDAGPGATPELEELQPHRPAAGWRDLSRPHVLRPASLQHHLSHKGEPVFAFGNIARLNS